MPWPWSTGGSRGVARLDGWLTRGAWKLEHHSLEIEGSPSAVLAAVGGVRLRDVPIVGGLFTLRGLPFQSEMTLLRFFGTTPFLVLEEEPGRELVFGVVGPFWRWRGGALPPSIPRTPEEFREAVSGGRVAAIGNFRVEPIDGRTRLWTETWVAAPGVGQAVAFTGYWLVVGPVSAWIRRILLRAGQRRAQA